MNTRVKQQLCMCDLGCYKNGFALAQPVYTCKCVDTNCNNRLNKACLEREIPYQSSGACMYHCSSSSNDPPIDPPINPGLIHKGSVNTCINTVGPATITIHASTSGSNTLLSSKRSITESTEKSSKKKENKVAKVFAVDTASSDAINEDAKTSENNLSTHRHHQTLNYHEFGDDSDGSSFVADNDSDTSTVSDNYDDSDDNAVITPEVLSISNNKKTGTMYDFFGNAHSKQHASSDDESSTVGDSNAPPKAACARQRSIKKIKITKVRASRSSSGAKRSDTKMTASSCFSKWKSELKLVENKIQPFSSMDKNGKMIVSTHVLKCYICNNEVGLKKSSVKNHIFGSKDKTGKRPKESEHSIRKKRKDNFQQEVNTAEKSYQERQHFVLNNSVQGKQGDALAPEVNAYRQLVLEALLCAGIPLSLMNTESRFKQLLESIKFTLPYSGFTRLIPIVRTKERELVRTEIEGKKIAVIFDGTTDRAEVFCVVFRFVDHDQKIQHRCAALRFYKSSFDGDNLCAVLNDILLLTLNGKDEDEFSYKIPADLIQYAIRDGASVNTSAVDSFSRFCAKQCKDVICFSHSLNVIGNCLTDQVTLSSLKEFIQCWSRLVKNSQVCRSTFHNLCQKKVEYLSYVRWFTLSEVINQVLSQFSAVKQIITSKEIEDREGSRNNLEKMLEIETSNTRSFTGEHMILLSLALVIDIGNPIRDACYFLEGDGFLSPFAYQVMEDIGDKFTVLNNNFKLGDGNALSERQCDDIFRSDAFKQLLPKCYDELKIIVEIDLKDDQNIKKKRMSFLHDLHYLLKDVYSKFSLDCRGKLSSQIKCIFRACRFCNIAFIYESNDVSIDKELDDYVIFDYFCDNVNKDYMRNEFAKYRVCVRDYVHDKFDNLHQLKQQLDGKSLWEFWRRHKTQLPHWYQAAEHFALIATSSAAVERVFSLYDNKFSDKQQSALEDLKEGAIMIKANSIFRGRL